MVVKKVKEGIWEVEKDSGMHVPGIIYASDELMKVIEKDGALEQVKNVARLPGILEKSIAMPDIHVGYGFSIGGVAAFSLDKGIVSPGGVGYDINCGVRLLSADLMKKDFLKKRKEVTHDIVRSIPSGVGRRGEFSFNEKGLKEILEKGVERLGKYVQKEDLDRIEDSGCIKGADSSKVSNKAIGRGRNQLGTLGAGNHFLEVQFVEEVLDKKVAKEFGLKEGQVVIMIHSGSRGLGHQVASDYIKKMEDKYGWEHLPDRQLASAPLDSRIAQDYIGAMRAAANFAFCNRQLMTYKLREVFERHFGKKLEIVYDIAHNIAKFEKHNVNGKMQEVCVHRKGATRSFGPGRKELGKKYKKTGCPIFIPGSMGTASYVLVGTKEAEKLSWGSAPHGAGRLMSRKKANESFTQKSVKKELDSSDVYIEAGSVKGIIEEAPGAYKDVEEVVKVSDDLGIARVVAKLKPLAVVKG